MERFAGETQRFQKKWKKELEAEGQKEQKAGAGELQEDPFPQQRKEPENKKGELQPDLEQALLAVPMARLRQALKTRGLREFLAHAEAGGRPGLEAGASGTVLTVRFPWNERIVKLLCPLEHSSCTCHSRELCVHKAQAVLAFQLQKGAVTLEELKAMDSAAPDWDLEELSQAARQMKEGIRLQLLTGLSRLSPEAEEAMERLAVISHGAGLADFETELRAAASEYRQYFRRSGAFRTEDLLGRLLALYGKASLLERTKEPETIRQLAGTFRDAYHPGPRLHLTAIGGRSFKSKAGYEGERYYFLETEQKKWYTWTDARPSFYEGIRRRPPGNEEHAQAPWGLNCSRGKMMELEFYLTDAKAANGGRLSVSRETKSEIVGNRDLSGKEIREMVIWDYRRLFQRQMIQRLSFYCAGSAKGVLKEWFSTNNPYEIAKGGRLVHVEVKSLPLPVSSDSYRVEWTETVRSHAGVALESTAFEATVTIRIVPPTSEAVLLHNPGGVYITHLSASKVFK